MAAVIVGDATVNRGRLQTTTTTHIESARTDSDRRRVTGNSPGMEQLHDSGEDRQPSVTVLVENRLIRIVESIHRWTLERKIVLIAEYLPGESNHEADQMSRIRADYSQMKLSPSLFTMVNQW